MALDYLRESLEGIDEGLQALYQEKEGKYYLDVAGVMPMSEYDAKTIEFKGKEKALRKKADEYMNTLKGYGDYTPETVKELESKMKELELNADSFKGTSEDVEKKIQALKEYHENKSNDLVSKYTTQLSEKDSMISQVSNQLLEMKKDIEIRKEVEKWSREDTINDSVYLLKDMIDYNQEGETFEGKENGLTIAEVCEKFYKDRPLFCKPSNSGGATGNKNGQSISNPFKSGQENKTEQAKMFRENPELARRLQKEAGLV